MKENDICLFCDEKLTAGTAPEHILLNSLGGRKTTRYAICSYHNNLFGSTIDQYLSKQAEFLRNLLHLKSGTGRPPPVLKNVPTKTASVNLKSDGRPQLINPPFRVNQLPDGRQDISVYAETPEELIKILPHLAAKLSISEDQLIKNMKDGNASKVEMSVDEIHYPFSLGGEEALRSITKSCMVLLSTNIQNQALKGDQFSDVRDFILLGGTEFNSMRINTDSRKLPCAEEIEKSYGPIFNLLHIQSNERGKIVGYFTLYNIIGWRIVLVEKDGPPNIKTTLISNPLNPATWSDNPTEISSLTFEWLDTIDPTYDLDIVKKRLISIMGQYVENTREQKLMRICEDVFQKHGVDNDDLRSAENDVQDKVIKEIAARFTAHVLRLPYEQKISPDEIETMLTNNHETKDE